MKKNKLLKIIVVLMSVCLFACGGGSDGDDAAAPDSPDPAGSDLEFSGGLKWNEEEWENTEKDIIFGAALKDLPAKVDLTGYFPPIGDQGDVGTCTSWAIGYYLKSYLEAKDRGIKPTGGDMQFSPKFLYWMIENDQTSKADCTGSTFEANLDVLQNEGIATLRTVPYEDLGPDCSIDSGQIPPAWRSEASGHLIENYRKINHKSIAELKEYLAKERPVVFGAYCGRNFMKWTDDSVFASDPIKDDNNMHAMHAMILAGYDDAKGENGAFLVVNSWGEAFGDRGRIWVDYNFFVNEFTFAAFVAKNKRPADFNPEDTDTYDPQNSTADLLAWQVNIEDFEIDDPEYSAYRGRSKRLMYSVYNVGERMVMHTEDWAIALIYYNAYDANDNGILWTDRISDRWDPDFDFYDEESNIPIGQNSHQDFETGRALERTVSSAVDILIPDSLNGNYYIALVADYYNNIQEYDESNNVLWWTNEPLYIRNGVIQGRQTGYSKAEKIVTPVIGASRSVAKILGEEPAFENPNTYTQEEITKLFTHYKNSGELDKKYNASSITEAGPRIHINPLSIREQ